tara:strand:- start:157 stop:711 length:555 start_codon:yes stop_codon:yes gene_type:complete
MEIYNDWLVSKMTRSEINELSTEEKKERDRLKHNISNRQYKERNPEKQQKYREEHIEEMTEYNKRYYQENTEKIIETSKKYRENHPEKVKERKRKYSQTPNGKKVLTLMSWKLHGLEETKEDLEWIYELWQTQEFCYSCNVKLTRDGDNSQDQACMDHDHTTHKFRQICCRSCNTQDRWMKYWC